MKSVTAMVPKIREITQMKNLDTHCRNCGNLLSLFSDKNPWNQRFPNSKVQCTVWKLRKFRESNVLVKKVLQLQSSHSTLWKLRNFTATVFRKFSVKSMFYKRKNFTVNWFDEKKFPWQCSEFLVFPHCGQWKSTIKRYHKSYGKLYIFPSNQRFY